MKLTIPGDPIPCARPRLSAASGFVRVYDKQAKSKAAIKTHCMAEWRRLTSGWPLTGPVSFRAIYRLPIAKSDPSWLRNRKSWGLDSAHKSREDVDNMGKFYMDCLTQIAYADDRQVVALNAVKVYSLNPRTEIEIMAIDGPQISKRSEEILEMFGPAEFADLVECCEDIHAIAYDSDATEGMADAASLERIADAIQRISATHSKVLAKIAKAYPT